MGADLRGLSDGPAPHAGAIARAGRLLNATLLVAGERRFRPVEVEFYGQGGQHFDPFAHAHAIQREAGRWYFHRAGPRGGYKAGSYAGLDVAWGSPDFAVGFLFRSLRAEDGELVCGPALCVRALLAATGSSGIGALDQRAVSVEEGPLRLEEAALPAREVIATPRVGLTLKKADHAEARRAFLFAPYRFTTEPRLPKGRTHTALALLAAGVAPAEVEARTGARAGRLWEAMQEGGAVGYEGEALARGFGRGFKAF